VPAHPSTASTPSPFSAPAPRPPWLTAWEKRALLAFLGLVVAFGLLVELRSAFMERRMGDLVVFLRTAWAVRTGRDIYTITDHNGFHYHYPPLFAILLVPLADPPPWADHAGMLPYPVTVALWYVLNLVFVAAAVHLLACALEQRSPDPAVRSQPAGCRRWWALRLVPVLLCLPPIGHTLMRGQVNLLLLLLVCGTAAALLRGRSWQAGLWLAGAICLKVIPAYLLLYPLWRRDYRCLAGCALGLVLGLGLIPAAVLGPARTLAYYREWSQVLAAPGLGIGEDSSRGKELLEANASDSQSFEEVFHNTLHPDRATRPQQRSFAAHVFHWLAGGLLTGLTLTAGRRRWRGRPAEADGPETVLRFGALVQIMLLLSPVCHLHYFALSLPLVMGMLALAWERREVLPRWVALVLAANVVASVLPHIPELFVLRDLGLAAYAAVLLWLAGWLLLWQQGPGRLARPLVQPVRPRVAPWTLAPR
jgi:hypothetical protein